MPLGATAAAESPKKTLAQKHDNHPATTHANEEAQMWWGRAPPMFIIDPYSITIPEKARQAPLMPDDAFERLVIKLQRKVRAKYLYPARMHRKNLADRLLFETSIVRGTFR